MHIHMAMVIRHGVQPAFWELKLMMCEITVKALSMSTALPLKWSKTGPKRHYSTPRSSGSSSRIFGELPFRCFG